MSKYEGTLSQNKIFSFEVSYYPGSGEEKKKAGSQMLEIDSKEAKLTRMSELSSMMFYQTLPVPCRSWLDLSLHDTDIHIHGAQSSRYAVYIIPF